MASEEKIPRRRIFETYGSDHTLLILTDHGDNGLTMEIATHTAPLVSLLFVTRLVDSNAWKFSDLFEFLQEIAARQTANALGDSGDGG
jgi:hypothetical protein